MNIDYFALTISFIMRSYIVAFEEAEVHFHHDAGHLFAQFGHQSFGVGVSIAVFLLDVNESR